MSTPHKLGLTTQELAARNPKIRRVDDILAILRSSKRMDIVEEADGRWQLTTEAEQTFGEAFRGLSMEL